MSLKGRVELGSMLPSFKASNAELWNVCGKSEHNKVVSCQWSWNEIAESEIRKL